MRKENMKRLLVISSRYPHKYDSFKSIFIYSQIEELRKDLEKVMIIATTPYTPKFYKKWKEAKRKADSLAENYYYDNVEVYFTKNIVAPINSLKKLRGFQGLRTSLKILKKTKFKPELIHAHFTWPSGYVAMKLKEELGIPYLITSHGYDAYELPFRNKFYFNIVKEVLDNANQIITVSNNNQNVMVKKLNVPPEKITVIPNGYDPKSFRPLDKNIMRKKLSLPFDKKIVLSVGNLAPIKGQIHFVKAAKEIINKRKDTLFILIGDGPERENLNKEIKKLNLKDNFILPGAKPYNEIPSWINACDIFVIPSLNEAGPAVLLEALACGKPVIGTEVGIIPEIIPKDNLGLVVPTADANALADGILKMLDTGWDDKYIQDCVKKYTWENVAEKIVSIYSEILK
jgi:glycosyltransferase involved in cell wall biosynthesis